MGIDGTVFDAVSREFIDYDRDRNLRAYDAAGEDDEGDRLRGWDPHGDNSRLNSAELVNYATRCVEYWTKEGDANRAWWAARVVTFARNRPNGRFFARDDADWHIGHQEYQKLRYAHREVGGYDPATRTYPDADEVK